MGVWMGTGYEVKTLPKEVKYTACRSKHVTQKAQPANDIIIVCFSEYQQKIEFPNQAVGPASSQKSVINFIVIYFILLQAKHVGKGWRGMLTTM